MSDNAHAQHGDKRTEERADRYGELATKNVDELQQMARDRGIGHASEMKKDELLEALSKSD